MKFLKLIKSTEDNTIKYIFKLDDTLDNFLVEFSYINKNDGKDIICVPSQTMCNLACKFCHTTDYIGKMKTKVLVLLVLIGLLFASCAEQKTIDGVTYRPYGIFNQDTQKNPNIEYELSGWAIFSGVVFVETIIVPIYTFGYNLWEPVGLKSIDPSKNGIIKEN